MVAAQTMKATAANNNTNTNKNTNSNNNTTNNNNDITTFKTIRNKKVISQFQRLIATESVLGFAQPCDSQDDDDDTDDCLLSFPTRILTQTRFLNADKA